MTARQQLNEYIEQLQRRFRLRAFLRGAAILALSALVTTLVLVLITNALAFSRASLTTARIILFLIIAGCIVFACTLPLLRLNRRRTAWEAEAAVPGFEQRLVTLAERGPEDREPFAELLAADTLALARAAEATRPKPLASRWPVLSPSAPSASNGLRFFWRMPAKVSSGWPKYL